MNLAFYTLKTVEICGKHGQRIAYSWFNSIKNLLNELS